MKTNLRIFKLLLLLSVLSIPVITTAQSVGAGGWHSVAICNDGSVKAFGENATGQLGNGSTTDSSTPTTVPGLSGIIGVSGGGDQLEAHSLALKNDGTVWTWGSNLYGGLGNGSTASTTAPIQTLGLSNVIQIAAGGWHSAALKNDGTVWSWGWNLDGQLGDNTVADKLVPVQASGLSNVIKISAGTYHTLALKSDGTVWAWGDNVSGQIGDGSTTSRSLPTQVSGLSGVISISAGRFFSLAVKSDGTVWTWGENLYGQLGNGNTNDSSIPVQVSGLTGITSGIVATGAFHCMAYKSDNTVWSWGRNTYGNLGDGSLSHRSSPVFMLGIADIAGLAAGTNFSLLYKTDGTFWGCGRNLSGQLGDGTFLQRNTASQSTVMCPVLQPAGLLSVGSSSSLEVSAYPNPSSTGIFSIQIDDASQNENASVEVYDVLGKKVTHLTVSQAMLDKPIQIDLSTESNGVYFMSVRIAQQKFYQKLIKQ